MPDLRRPEQVTEALVEMLAAGDFEAAAALYEDDAVFVEVHAEARGGSIAAAHREFVEAGYVLHPDRFAVMEAGGLALVHWAWTVTKPDGSAFKGVSAEVLRRQPDGTWKFVIDNSDGAAVLWQDE